MSLKILFEQPIVPTYMDGFLIEVEVSYDYTDEDVKQTFFMDGLEESKAESIIQFFEEKGNLTPSQLENDRDFRELFGWQDFINNGVWPFDRFDYDNLPTAYCSHKIYYYKQGRKYPVVKEKVDRTVETSTLQDLTSYKCIKTENEFVLDIDGGRFTFDDINMEDRKFLFFFVDDYHLFYQNENNGTTVLTVIKYYIEKAKKEGMKSLVLHYENLNNAIFPEPEDLEDLGFNFFYQEDVSMKTPEMFDAHLPRGCYICTIS